MEEHFFTGTYAFAGQSIRICSIYKNIHIMCRAYRTDSAPVLEVRTDQNSIAFERMQSDRAGSPGSDSYSDAYLETLAVYRKIAEMMPEYGTILFHGSCIAADGSGYLFTAVSGTGKSTHTRLWRELLGDRAAMVNDDKPLIKMNPDGTATACGTPWDGKHHLSSNITVPLKAVCILERAAENRIRAISFSEALPMLIQQAYRPMNTEALERTLHLIDQLGRCVKFFRLGCNMDISAAELSYIKMSQE